MNIKLPMIIVAFVIAIFLIAFYFAFFQKKAIAPIGTIDTIGLEPKTEENSEILKKAQELYNTKKQEGTDFSSGPCLGKIEEDWIVDIAHSPRELVDDKKENQCADFLEEKVGHFVELDEAGNLIKMY